MKTSPLISVIMPVFNSAKFIKESIKSILSQTYTKFELIIINDGSTDNTIKIISRFRDSRIIILSNKQRLGVAKSLNIGLKVVRGTFIARMDADDISLPHRFEKQVTFLLQNPQVGVVGTNVELINESGKKIRHRKVNIYLDVERALTYCNPIFHSSVLFQRNLIKRYGIYDENLNGAEDYDLWLRFSRHAKIINLPKTLLYYRAHAQGISFRNLQKIQISFLKTQLKSIFTYHYAPWRIIFTIKPFIMILLPNFLKRWIYRKVYAYT